MKKLMTLLLMFIVLTSWSQGFEGTIKWSMKMDVTDPKTKAEMEKMNDPANQAKMKEMQAKMNDPQFKAQMDANPQMKAQMEAMMKSMGAGGGASSMMPTGMLLKLKGGNTLTMMQGGMMDGFEILHMKDKDQSVRIDRKAKTWSPLGGPPKNGAQDAEPKFKVTKTGETMKILGYNATKYVGETTEQGKPANVIFWTTTELKDIDMKGMMNQRMGPGNRRLLPEGVEGVPLRIETSMKEGNMVMEMTEIKKESLPASDFTIPSDFKEVKMGMGGRP
jgi:hypothetical protein